MTNKERFIEAYTEKLVEAILKNPGDYMDTVGNAPGLAKKMVDKIESCHVSDVMRKAARKLKIGTSRAAIIEYIRS